MRRREKPELTPEKEILIAEYAEPGHTGKMRYKMLDNSNDLSEFPKLEKATIGGVELDCLLAASDAEREFQLRILYKFSVEEHVLDV